MVSSPTFIKVYASGTIQRGSVVEFSRSKMCVVPASSSTTYTNIFGVAIDYAQGNSDTIVRVIPFQPGQLWQVDCANMAKTSQLFIKHALSSNVTIANTSYDQTVATGVFMPYVVTNATGTMIGEFIRAPIGWVEGARVGYF